MFKKKFSWIDNILLIVLIVVNMHYGFGVTTWQFWVACFVYGIIDGAICRISERYGWDK